MYTFRGASEEAPGAEATNGSDSNSSSGSNRDDSSEYSGSEFAGHSGCGTIPALSSGSGHTSPFSLTNQGNANAQDTAGGVATVGGAANCSCPGSVDAPAVEDHVQEREQPNTAVDFGNEPLINNFGAGMVADEHAALPLVGIARQEDASSAAATKQGWQPVASRASPPWLGTQAGEAWRRMVHVEDTVPA